MKSKILIVMLMASCASADSPVIKAEYNLLSTWYPNKLGSFSHEYCSKFNFLNEDRLEIAEVTIFGKCADRIVMQEQNGSLTKMPECMRWVLEDGRTITACEKNKEWQPQ